MVKIFHIYQLNINTNTLCYTSSVNANSLLDAISLSRLYWCVGKRYISGLKKDFSNTAIAFKDFRDF